MSDLTAVLEVPVRITSPAAVLRMARDIDALAEAHQRLGSEETAEFLESFAALLGALGGHLRGNAEYVTQDVLDAWGKVMDDPELRDQELRS